MASILPPINSDELEANIEFLLEICPKLQMDAARAILESCENFDEALSVATDICGMESTNVQSSSSENVNFFAQRSSSSFSAPNDENELENALKQVINPVKRDMARELMLNFPQQSKDAIVVVAERYLDINEAASHLFDNISDTDINGNEMREEPVKSEKVEYGGLSTMDGSELFEASVDPKKSDQSDLKIVDSVEPFATHQAFGEISAAEDRSSPHVVVHCQTLNDLVASQEKSFLNPIEVRSGSGQIQPFTIRTGPTEDFNPLTPSLGREHGGGGVIGSGSLSLFDERETPGISILPTQTQECSERLATAPTSNDYICGQSQTSSLIADHRDVVFSLSSAGSKSSSVTTPLRTPCSMSRRIMSTELTSNGIWPSDGEDSSEVVGRQAGEKSTSLTHEQKLEFLNGLFPHADINTCENELQLQEGVLQDAVDSLEAEYTFASGLHSEDGPQGGKPLLRGNMGGTSAKDQCRSEIMQGNRPAAKKRTGSISAADTPSPATKRFCTRKTAEENAISRPETPSEWMSLHTTAGTIRVVLDDGIHPFKFTKNMLMKLEALRDELAAVKEDDPKASITITDVKPHIFNLAVYWSVCNHIQLELADMVTNAVQFETLVGFVTFAERVGLKLRLEQEGSEIMAAIRKLLIAERDILQGSHIRSAWHELDSSHPLRTLFLEAVLRPRMEFCYAATEITEDSSDESEPDSSFRTAAHRALLKRPQAPFMKELERPDAILEFVIEFFELRERSWRRRQLPTEKKPKSRNAKRAGNFATETTMLDPLTKEMFVI